MLLGKYARRPAIPFLSALAMLGYGIAGALGPYLTTALRDVDPRIPFATASVVLMLTTLGMIAAEKRLAASPPPASKAAPVRAFGTMTKPAIVFALGMIALALGYQMHFALDSAPLYLKFTKAPQLQWLMPVFWIGFNISMFPASAVTKRLGGYAVMGGAALIGALAIVAAHLAQSLDIPGGGAIRRRRRLGRDPDECLHGGLCHRRERRRRPHGRPAVSRRWRWRRFTRILTVATGINADPSLKAVLQWAPTVCWAAAGAALLYLAAARVKTWVAR